MDTMPETANSGKTTKRKRLTKSLKGLRVISVLLLFSAAVLVLALIASFVFGGGRDEAGYVNKDDYQAVFLTNGQVYFGKVKSLNEKYVRINDIYYLNVNQQVQPDASKSSSNAQSVTLVKLGCEIHGPADQMVINRSQLSFWENLKTDGKVAKAIADFKKTNPNGQDCSKS